MCLGIPGEIQAIEDDPLRKAKVSFGGIVKEVALVYVPEAKVGDYVIVHAGFAISRLDAERAKDVFSYLDEMGSLTELDEGET